MMMMRYIIIHGHAAESATAGDGTAAQRAYRNNREPETTLHATSAKSANTHLAIRVVACRGLDVT